MQEEQAVHPLDYLSVWRRRKWWFIVPLFACVLAGVALAVLLPREYRASARIAVTGPAVSSDLVQGTGVMNREERLRAITQQLLSRTVLTRVARETGLAGSGPLDAAVVTLREGVVVSIPEMLVRREPSEPLESFDVSYRGGDPSQVQLVTNRLADVFIDETSRARATRAGDTSEFLARQVRTSRQRLDELEAQVTRAKEAHMGRLPEQTNANLQIVGAFRQQLESNAVELRGEQDRLNMIVRQIDSMRKGAEEAALPSGPPDPQAPSARVVALERQLAQALSVYKETHPEIGILRRDLEAARQEAAAEKVKPESDRLAVLQTDPAYRQLLKDQAAAEVRIRDLQFSQNQARQQIGEYQNRVEAAPKVEQQLQSLTREYELQKQQYKDFTEKYQNALLAEDLERRRGGEQFRVLYPAALPQEPEWPQPGRMLLIATLLGLGLGAALMVGREFLDRSVHDARALQQEFELPVLAEIPRIERAA